MLKEIIRQILRVILLENLFFQVLFLSVIKKNLKSCNTILELGAGMRSYIRQISGEKTITAFNIHEPTLKSASEKGVYKDYIQGDVRKINTFFNPGSYDAVVAFDLIEHLEKKEGIHLIENMVLIARRKVIIYTPNGFLYQAPTNDNLHQEHLSGWSYEEMKNLGFIVHGVNGNKKLTGEYGIPKIKPQVIGNFIRNINWLMLKVFKREQKSYSILCIKDVTG